MRTIDSLPDYLKIYCIEQDYSKYTARDHAAWRYIMRRGLPFFRKHAVWVYEDGLAKTGLPLDRIPTIDGMDQALQKIGWGAVGVCGFIPPWAFLEFQARSILPIATDMRSVEHIGYTPAPDIVHEAAGHAPILPDQEYADYLARYAQTCCKAIYSDKDNKLFEAIRVLSDIKEKPGVDPSDIAKAERNLDETIADFTYVSEQSRVARMSWWTNEYGLVGSLEDPKIFGAGLLSSVAESKALFGDHVKKLRLSIDCTNQSYDITKPQPQLYVAENMQHLISVLEELDETLAHRRGGNYGLNLALESKAITSVVLDSGISITGRLEEIERDQADRAIFLKWGGPVQLAKDGTELPHQGIARHPSGFSCPIGRWRNQAKSPSAMTKDDLTSMGFGIDKLCEIHYESGFELRGRLKAWDFDGTGACQLLTFVECSITKGSKQYYDPSWGLCDVPLAGYEIPSVFGGPADRGPYGEHELPNVVTQPGREQPYAPEEIKLFQLYQTVRELRDTGKKDIPKLTEVVDTLLNEHPSDWLLKLEALELSTKHWGLNQQEQPFISALESNLFESNTFDDDTKTAIAEGKVILHA